MPVDVPGRLSTMPHPRGGAGLAEDMEALAAAGVDVLVSLQTDAERRALDLTGEGDAAARAGLEFHAFPIADLGVPEDADIVPLLDLLLDRVRRGRHVMLHCYAGVGRSSLVAAALMTRLGTPPERAWALISAARGRPVPETPAQGEWLNAFAVRGDA